ncbi:response regulator [Chengkuizengella axinellae]|uniref:Response regulator n=1 Tax=Chengkuizengella axinellae TaxID=3064388 RepID=A0ABT9J0X6_9BACL|nr:response regulator [Chengkuizengella sp. 2205SS18-9]MDP5275281.1 response regulator [Chengkuizengella sp. 2205SS18-9]
MIKAFLIDDEEHALSLLELFLNDISGVEVVGKMTNPAQALEMIKQNQPHVIFLDIEMPLMNGIEFAELLHNEQTNIEIVFATAYDQYAISAFEYGAMDYILKPLEKGRLQKTVERMKKKVVDTNKCAIEKTAASRLEEVVTPKIHVQTFGEFEVFIEGYGKYKWRTAKEKELFAFLTLHAQHGVHRDVIIEALWGDEHFTKAKVYLHTCISYIRKNLKQFGITDIILFKEQKYYINANYLQSDYLDFVKAIDLVDASTETTQEIEKLLTISNDKILLDGNDYFWAEKERESLNKKSLELRLALAKMYKKNEQYQQAAEVLNELIHLNSYNEEGYRLLMTCYLKMGNHDKVLSVYKKLVKKLDELEISPSELTKQILNQLNINL